MSKRSGIMLCAPLEERRLPGTGWVNSWNSWPVIVQPKLDGERDDSVWDPELGYNMFSSERNIFNSIPHINDALNEQIHNRDELDGELYVHGMSFSDIHSIVSRTTNFHPRFQDMEYHIFDIVNEDPQHKRLVTLSKLDLKPPLIRVPAYIAHSFDEIMKYYDTILAQGYEGIIVRNIDNYYVRKRSMDLMKFKPKKDDYYTIVGWKEEVSIDGQPKSRIGSLTCAGSETSNSGGTFSVGTGLSDDDRSKLWEERDHLQGRICHVKYQNINPSGAPRFPVFLEILDSEPEQANFLLNL